MIDTLSRRSRCNPLRLGFPISSRVSGASRDGISLLGGLTNTPAWFVEDPSKAEGKDGSVKCHSTETWHLQER